MKVLMVKPGKKAYEAEIENTLAAMQHEVDGYIEAVYPYEDLVAVVCNEEGKLEGLPLNRALRDEDGKVYEIIAGTFFICGLSETNFDSLAPELMEKYKAIFENPQTFVQFNGEILAIDI